MARGERRPARDPGRFLGQRPGELAFVGPGRELRRLRVRQRRLSSRPGYSLALCTLFFYPFPLAWGAGLTNFPWEPGLEVDRLASFHRCRVMPPAVGRRFP